MYLEKAKLLLDMQYDAYYDKADEFGRMFMDEKKRHSYQVLGVGNYLLRHEPVFRTCPSMERDRLQAIVLLHDIGRFYEAFVGKGVDHGIVGADILAKTDAFRDADCILSVRHHGHLIEKLYDDCDYLKLSEADKQKVDTIIYLVRDADKLANFYLLSREFAQMENLFFPKVLREGNQRVSLPVKEAFMAHCSVNKADVCNCADQALMFFACLYDVRFVSSFGLIRKWNVMQKLLQKMAKFWQDEERDAYVNEVLRFLDEKQRVN